MSEHEGGRFRSKELARRAALDRTASPADRASRIEQGPGVGKRSLTEEVAAGYSAVDGALRRPRSIAPSRRGIDCSR
jgi:hypothetical protein